MTLHPRRHGQINAAWLAFLASIVLFVALVTLLFWDPLAWLGRKEEEKRPLVVYCAAGLKAPVEQIARDYERDFGVPVQLQYGGSETLLSTIQVNPTGDIYLPADASYLVSARSRGLTEEELDVAAMRPVVIVPRGNPRKISRVQDLLRDDVRLAQANPDAAAIGKLSRDAFRRSGHWDALAKKTHVFKGTVSDVANDVKVGAVDAGIVWDVTARLYPDLDIVDLPELASVRSRVSLGVLKASKQPTAALRFARYLTARDRGLPVFTEHGFQVIEGDEWAERPQIRLLAGAMLRPAIQDTLRDFEQREGLPPIETVYNGCGILVAQMKAGERPDAYLACDRSFMTQVHDLFVDETTLSTNQLVILVPKGNPHNIKALRDLGQPGLRLGVGHEQQCALGALTQTTLEQTGTQGDVMKNVKVRSPTGDLLVNKMRTGSLDAVIAYVSNATVAADELDAIAIDVPCAIAVQPVAVGKQTKYPQLTARLLRALRSAESKDRFEKAGFRWKTP